MKRIITLLLLVPVICLGQRVTPGSNTLVTKSELLQATVSRTTVADADYTVLSTDKYVAITSISATRTMTLPLANSVTAGYAIIIGDESGSVTSSIKISIARAGSNTIDGATSEDITSAYGFRVLFSDGSSKWTFDGGVARLAATQALTNKTYNGNTWTAGTGILTIAASKTLTVNNTVQLTATDGTIINVGAATSGKVLIGDGTNMVLSTSTIPTSAGSTAGKILRSDGTNYVLSTPTLPNTGTTGKLLIGDGTNYVESTPTYPNATATSRAIIVGDGTNYVKSTETWAVPGTAGNVLQSDGTNWTAVTGGWTTLSVAGSDVTTTGQSLVDITGLITGTLTVSTTYEFEAVLWVTTSAVASGTKYGVNVTGTGSPAAYAVYWGAVTSTTGAVTSTNALTSGDATAFLTTSSANGCVIIKGVFVTGTGSPAFSIQHLKVTSGTSTVKIGSTLRYRKM